MKSDYLASGFADVDASVDSEVFAECLSLLDSLPYFQWYKSETYRHLQLQPGLSVLDVGCGLGDDARRMSAMVSPEGHIVGIDSSSTMIERARLGKSDEPEDLRFEIGDAKNLPFQNDSFDRCRVDRTLQHIANPEIAIRELWRVLKPGGLAVAYDNDWGTFSINSLDTVVTRKIQDEWCYSFKNPWIGRHLSVFFQRAGFVDVEINPSISSITDFSIADKVYHIRKTAERLVASNLLSSQEARNWLEDLERCTREGSFNVGLTTYLVVGRKP